jgi:regulatory protein
MWKKKWNPKEKDSAENSNQTLPNPEKAREKTMHRAVKLLAAKPRSVVELRERLLEKSWTNAEIVNEILDRLKEYGYLNDAQFAHDLAVSKIRQKPQGKRRLQQTLSRKRIDKKVADKALEQVFEVHSESELVERALIKRIRLRGKPETREETKKLFDYLLRQGFQYDLIREQIQQISKIEIEPE